MKRVVIVAILAVIAFATISGCAKKADNTIEPPPKADTLATVTTDTINSITAQSVGDGGVISNDGGAAITQKGLCWDTKPHPTVSLITKTIEGTGAGAFSSNITGLRGLHTYYIRAYATNRIGTAYGNEITFTTPFGIGANYNGGVVAYVLLPGDPGYSSSVQHGIIAAPIDLSSPADWSDSNGYFVAGTSTAIGTGLSNTNAIIATQGAGNYAAMLCHNFNYGGYNDWSLPSKDEMNQVYLNRAVIGGFPDGTPDYWSSSQVDFLCAWCLSFFGEGWDNDIVKESGLFVRPVRYF